MSVMQNEQKLFIRLKFSKMYCLRKIIDHKRKKLLSMKSVPKISLKSSKIHSKIDPVFPWIISKNIVSFIP